MNRSRLFVWGFLLASLLPFLSGCSGIRDDLGLARHSPDEFTVVKRAPLSLPPEYNLRPPGRASRDASAARTATGAREEARQYVFGSSPSATEGEAAGGEGALLTQLGVDAANPDIRNILDREYGIVPVQERAVAEKLIFWKAPEPEQGVIIDPVAEAERLKKNREEGAPVNAGEVPVIRREKSTIEKLF